MRALGQDLHNVHARGIAGALRRLMRLSKRAKPPPVSPCCLKPVGSILTLNVPLRRNAPPDGRVVRTEAHNNDASN